MDNQPFARAKLCIEGLSIGDAFGQQFFYPGVLETATKDNLPTPPWNYTDDTEMALALFQVLAKHGQVDQNSLANTFAKRFEKHPTRGYGAGARELLGKLSAGGDWRKLVSAMFGGSGSFGNGGAMRVAPLGAWFCDDIDTLIEQATLSAEVTHTHSEGIIGTIAIALAAAWASQLRCGLHAEAPAEMLPWIIKHLDASEVKRRLEWAATYPLNTWSFTVASQVGCGGQISAQDTVPFCIWQAAASLDDFTNAMWTTARIGGDTDTTCAIIGGIVACRVGENGVPDLWKAYREPLPMVAETE